MKEKEERKKMEEVSKRNHSNVPKSQSDRIVLADPSLLDPKEILQQKLESQDYNPFGRQGGGAPNRKVPNQ
jgi:putative ubiquitin-RnfH superfamily antitoxin RatB of RatAB toxin-antitoxin module